MPETKQIKTRPTLKKESEDEFVRRIHLKEIDVNAILSKRKAFANRENYVVCSIK